MMKRRNSAFVVVIFTAVSLSAFALITSELHQLFHPLVYVAVIVVCAITSLTRLILYAGEDRY